MSFALLVPPPRPRALPLDWATLTRLASHTTAMRDLRTALLAHCDPAEVETTVGYGCPPCRSEIVHLRLQLSKIAKQVDEEFPARSYAGPGWSDLRSALKTAIDQLVQGLPPMRLTLRGLLFDLPPEIYSMIVAHLRDCDPFFDANAKKTISVLSIISRSWARRFRPLLFHTVHLRSSTDVQFLYNMLRSPLSRDLSHHIEVLSVLTEDFALATSHLIYSLRSLKELRLESYGAGRNPQELPSFPMRLRLGMSSLRKLSSFSLTGCTFHSFRAVMVFIKAFPHLESLSLLNVYWEANESGQEQFLPCNASFAPLKHVHITLRSPRVYRWAVPWAAAWLVAAPACTYQYCLRRRNATEEAPSDIFPMMDVIKLFHAHASLSRGFVGTLGKTSEGTVDSVDLTPIAKRTFCGRRFAYLHYSPKLQVPVSKADLSTGRYESELTSCERTRCGMSCCPRTGPRNRPRQPIFFLMVVNAR